VIPPEKHLAYALGYLQLELADEAREELSALAPEFLATPAALLVRLEIAMAEESWDEVIAISSRTKSAAGVPCHSGASAESSSRASSASSSCK
jgi:hypothetical protein